MATKFISADPEERGHFVASGQLADMAVRIVQKLKLEQPTESEASIDKVAKKLLIKTQAVRKAAVGRGILATGSDTAG